MKFFHRFLHLIPFTLIFFKVFESESILSKIVFVAFCYIGSGLFYRISAYSYARNLYGLFTNTSDQVLKKINENFGALVVTLLAVCFAYTLYGQPNTIRWIGFMYIIAHTILGNEVGYTEEYALAIIDRLTKNKIKRG